jgi:type IV secretory pathway VirB9-like protein
MLRLTVLLWVVMLLACTKEAPAPPPVPPAPEDLSFWQVPELVQPPTPEAPAPPPPKEPAPTPAEKVLDFAPGTIYSLTVAVGAPLDIVLGRGEQLRNLVGGDRTPVEPNQTTRLEVKEGADGIGETLRQHVFLTASVPGFTTGLTITTTLRTYLLTVKTVGKSPIRTVRWRYPAEAVDSIAKLKVPPMLPDPAQPKRWHVGYILTSSQKQAPDWLPRFVADDGRKLYVGLPEIALFETAPMVRMIGPNGPQLINARQYLNILIIDQLAPRLELRIGLGETAEVVTIARGALRTIACPGDEACPVWPSAAQVLAQRAPPVQPAPALTPPQPEPQPRTHVPAPVSPPIPPPPATPPPEGAQP